MIQIIMQMEILLYSGEEYRSMYLLLQYIEYYSL